MQTLVLPIVPMQFLLNANLSGASFLEANLTGANLVNANLQSTILRAANPEGL